MATGSITIEINTPKVVIHPTKAGQIVRPLKSGFGLNVNTTYSVAECRVMPGLPDEKGKAHYWVRLAYRNDLFRADRFEVVDSYTATIAEPTKEGDQIDLLQKREPTFEHRGYWIENAYIPVLSPGTPIEFRADSFTIYNPNEESMSIIPPLEVPAAPVEPAPEPLPPESASVQILRKLLEQRRSDLAVAQHSKAGVLESIEELERDLADERKSLAYDERAIAAAQASIDETLADIAKLGGRPEETPEAEATHLAGRAAKR